MKFNLNNPAFLQMAGNLSRIPETRFVLGPYTNEIGLVGYGDIVIKSVQNGVVTEESYVPAGSFDAVINSDLGTEVVILGNITEINTGEIGGMFSSIDVRKNPVLERLFCNDCEELSSLDVSKNLELNRLWCYNSPNLTSLDVRENVKLKWLDISGTGISSIDLSQNIALEELGMDRSSISSIDLSQNIALKELSCVGCASLVSLDISSNLNLIEIQSGGCTSLISLDLRNTSKLGSDTIFTETMQSITDLKVAGTSKWAYEIVESWLTNYSPNDGTILVDENTPQDVIDAATAKSWTVEYVDAA